MIPDIRFVNFSQPWTITGLGKIASKYYLSNQRIHHQNLLSLSYGKIKRKDINISKGLMPTSFDTYQIIRDGVIVMRFTDLQNDQKSLRIGIATEEGIISPAYVCISVNRGLISSFLYWQLHYYDNIIKLFYKMGDGMRQTLSYKDIESLLVSVPNSKEQEQMVSLFNTLDILIDDNVLKLSKTRQIKQSLLQKMFA